MRLICPYCLGVIAENIKDIDFKEDYIQCPNCRIIMRNPWKDEKS